MRFKIFLVSGLFLLVLTVLPVGTLYLRVLAIVFMYACLAQSWNWIGGYAGYAAFGNVGFFGIGAYTVGILLRDFGLSPFVTTILGGGFAALLALVIGYPALKLRATAYFSLVTMGVALLLSNVFLAIPSVTGAGRGIPNIHIPGLPIDLKVQVFYVIFLALMLVVFAITHKIEHSKFGYSLLAIRENEDAALACGINAAKTKLIAFALSAFFTGVVGGYYAVYISWINPGSAFSLMISVSPVVMCIFGGKGTWIGPLVGASAIELLRQFLSFTVSSELNLVIYGVVLVVAVIVIPKGIVGLFRGKLDRKSKC